MVKKILMYRFPYKCIGAGWLRPAQKSSYSRHEDPTFKLHSNHEGRPAGRPAPSPPGSGSGIRYIPTPNDAGREGYYSPHIFTINFDLFIIPLHAMAADYGCMGVRMLAGRAWAGGTGTVAGVALRALGAHQ